MRIPKTPRGSVEGYQYTDIHCHILPGIDDGARDWEESLAIAKNAVLSGAKRIVATPHVMRGTYDTEPDQIVKMVSELQKRLHDEDIDLPIIPGSEVFLSAGVSREYRAGRLQPIGDSGYILLEFSATDIPSFAEREIFDLRIAGAGIIIAHPERNLELARKRSTLWKLYDMDILFQVNAGSFVGTYGRQAMACAEYMLKERLVHFIGSDAHSGKPASASEVGADIRRALDRIVRISRDGQRILDTIESRSQRLLAGKL